MPTGLTDLDKMTEGGEPGSLWALSGPQGTPVSLLALGCARATALLAQRHVTWLSTHESAHSLAASIVAAEARCPYDMLLDEDQDKAQGAHDNRAEPAEIDASSHRIRAERDERVEKAKTALAASPYRFIRVDPQEIFASALDLLRTRAMDLLVLDHVDHNVLEMADLAALKRHAEDSGTWVVLVVDNLGQPRVLRGATTGHLEVAVYAEHPDLADPDGQFAGEAHLTVYRRGRRVGTDVVAFQAAYRRYVNVWLDPPYTGLRTGSTAL